MGAYNGSGTFVRTYSWANDKINNVKITASRMDTEDNGFAAGLSTAVCKDGQQVCTALVPFAVGISVPAGTAGAPGVAIIGDLTTGIYQSGSAAVDIAAAGTRVGGFTSAGLVNTAVGATTPSTGAFTSLSATGSLTVAGNVAVNTNKFTVNASTGNTVIAGTANITGNTTHSGTIIMNGSVSGSATIRVKATAGSSIIFQLPTTNGSSTNVLTTDGTGVTSWAPPAASSALTLLSTANASGAASVAFSSTFITSTYNKYIIEFDGLYGSTQTGLLLTISVDNGSNYLATNYGFAGQSQAYNSATINGSSNAPSQINIDLSLTGGGAIVSTSTAVASGTIKFATPSASTRPMFIFDYIDGNRSHVIGWGHNSGTAAFNNLKIAPGAGTFTGNFHLYGVQGT